MKSCRHKNWQLVLTFTSAQKVNKLLALQTADLVVACSRTKEHSVVLQGKQTNVCGQPLPLNEKCVHSISHEISRTISPHDWWPVLIFNSKILCFDVKMQDRITTIPLVLYTIHWYEKKPNGTRYFDSNGRWHTAWRQRAVVASCLSKPVGIHDSLQRWGL